MKQSVLFLALGLGAAGAFAQEVGQVISSTPIVAQVQVPRQVCQQGVVAGEPQTTGGGGLFGALAGTAIGSTIGGGTGTAAAMLLGAVGGAIVGNQLEANSLRGQVGTQCTTQMTYENRTVAYNVTYEYGGRQHTVQMQQDPGPTVQLEVRPVGAAAESQQYQAQSYPVRPQQVAPGIGARPGPVVVAPSMHSESMVVAPSHGMPSGSQPVYVQESYPVVVQQPVYVAYPAPAYAYRPYYYPPVGISLNLGYSRGWRHRR